MPTIDSMHTYTPLDSPQRPITAEFVASVCLRYPSERSSIIYLLHQSRGSVFVQHVLAALRESTAPHNVPRPGNLEMTT